MDGAGNLYVSDMNESRVRKIDDAGTIATFAGTGIQANSGVGGPGH